MVLDFRFRAYHAADLLYLFEFSVGLSPAQIELGNKMIAYWTNFARSGNPNSGGLEPVPLFGGQGPVTSFAPGDGGIRSTDFSTDHKCAFWSTIRF